MNKLGDKMLTSITEILRNILRKNFTPLDLMGYDSLKDFIWTVCGIKDKNLIPVLSAVLVSIFNAISNVIGDYVYDPEWGIFILFILTIVDIIVGMSKSIHRNGGIYVNRISRASVRFVMQTFIIFILTQMNGVWSLVIRPWMIDLILLTFVLSAFWSIVKNSYDLGWVNESTYLILQNALDINRLWEFFDQIKKFLKPPKK